MSSLTILKNLTIEKGFWNKENLVFCFENGKKLTIKTFTKILQKLLYTHMPNNTKSKSKTNPEKIRRSSRENGD
jgi:hypothetical protein